MKRSVSKSDITFSISEAAQPLFPSGSAGSFDFETNSERLCFRCECLNNLCDDPIAYNLIISYYTHNLNDFFCLKLYKFGIQINSLTFFQFGSVEPHEIDSVHVVCMHNCHEKFCV